MRVLDGRPRASRATVGDIRVDLFTGHPVVVTGIESAGEQDYADVEFVFTGDYGVRNFADLGQKL